MPIQMTNLATLVVNGVDLSDHVREITINMENEDLDATAMGAVSKAHAVGLRDDRFEVTFLQDYTAGKVDATLVPLQGSSTPFTVFCKPSSAATSSSNPSYTLSALLFNYTPIDVSVGEVSMPKVLFLPAPGQAIVRAVA